MNVLVIGKFYTEGFALHIAETLEVMGHKVRRFEPGYRNNRVPGRLGKRLDQVIGLVYVTSDNVPAVRSRRMGALWTIVEACPIDVVIVCHDFLWPGEVAELKRRSKAPIALWFPDSIANFHRAFFMNAPYDALFFKDPYILHALGDVLTSPVYYLPECCNPDRHCLPSYAQEIDPTYKCDITTAGNQHSWRVACYKHLSNYDVKLWGYPAPFWMPVEPIKGMYQGRSVYNDDKARAFLGAKVVVNHLLYGEIWGLNARCFEAAGIGAFQMVSWRPGLKQLFEDGKELISFSSMLDLTSKLNYWLPHEDQRNSIAEAGQRRALREHTYKHRLELLLATVTGAARGYPVPKLHVID